MTYRYVCGEKISALGMGMMRLPLAADGTIDEAKTAEMAAYAMENGVNYFDTAYGYHGGTSEGATGRALAAYPRDSYFLADKFPGYDLANMGKVKEIFAEQLRRCGVSYFDFYLFHNVCELNIDGYLDPANGILDYLLAEKRAGRIRHLGFSSHGSYETVKRFLDETRDEMEFCQLQVNYLDWRFQDAEARVRLLAERGIPVFVMEPLRGGKLAAPDATLAAKLAAVRAGETPVSLAFRFLQGIENAGVTLSGMSDFAQLKENVRIFNEDKPLNGAENAALLAVVEEMLKERILPCTACRYCVDHCPAGLDIPRLLKLYNEHSFTGGGFIAPFALRALPEDKRPTACLSCRSCEAVCPQQIKISEAMADFARRIKN